MKKQFDKEVKDLSDQIITDRCNQSQMNHRMDICSMSNWIDSSILIHLGQEISVLTNLGMVKCKRNEATHYALINRISPEATVKTLWIRKTQTT